jgi:hypothetical protein
MSDIAAEFKAESASLVMQMIELLEACEETGGDTVRLEKFAMYADRIMGACRQLMSVQSMKSIDLWTIDQLAQLCKLLGYKTSRLMDLKGLSPVAIGILLDASEDLKLWIEGRPSDATTDLLDRLHWLDQQFTSDITGEVPLSQAAGLIDRLKQSLKSSKPKS